MPIPDWKLQLIDWSATQATYGYISPQALTNSSKVIVTCGECKEPTLHTSVVSMRVRSDQKTRGKTKYTPICPSCQSRRNWRREEFRTRQQVAQSTAMKQVWEREGYRDNQSAKHAEIGREKWQDTEYRERVVAGVKLAHEKNPEYTAAVLRALWSPEAVVRRLEATQSEECRAKIIAQLTRPDYLELASRRSLRLWSDPDFRRRVTESNIANWQNNPARREKHAMALANQPRISSIQQTLYKLLGDLNVPFLPEGPETVIGHYVFDCLIPKEDGGGILVECQGEYWHTLPDVAARDRSKFTYVDRHFPEYEILYLWEHEFAAHERVLDRLKLKLGVRVPVARFQFSDVEVREIGEAREVREFLDAYHYIGKGRGGVSYGAYHGGELVGVAVYSPPLRQNTAGQFGVASENCRELSRFCIHPSYHKKNFASWFIARTLKRVEAPLVVAYADTTAGHHGTIYLAAGFQLHHVVDPDYWYVDGEGFVMHKRTLYGRARKLGLTERQYAEQFGYDRKWGGQKHCFVRRQP